MFSQIENELQIKMQFDQVSWINLKEPITISFYKKWLDQKFYGTMDYLNDHFQFKKNPKNLNPLFKSIITLTQSYYPAQKSFTAPARIALYAQNQDYHLWLKEKMNQSIDLLKQKFPHDIFSPYVDSSPILEKDFAYQAGHGWFGKNTCLIHPKKGSLFFICEILTSIEVNISTFENSSKMENRLLPLPDMCGTCTRCMDICPTKALINPREMKADQCISYLTIESKSNPPIELRSKMNDWFFGCDLCQTVCPWNQKVFRNMKVENNIETSTERILPQSITEKNELIHFFKLILNSSNKTLQKKFYGTALFRSGGFGLKRNALIVIANRGLTELEEDVKKYIQHPKLAELAEWTLTQLSTQQSHKVR